MRSLSSALSNNFKRSRFLFSYFKIKWHTNIGDMVLLSLLWHCDLAVSYELKIKNISLLQLLAFWIKAPISWSLIIITGAKYIFLINQQFCSSIESVRWCLKENLNACNNKVMNHFLQQCCPIQMQLNLMYPSTANWWFVSCYNVVQLEYENWKQLSCIRKKKKSSKTMRL